MKIKRIKLANFRNLQDLELEITADLVVLVGPNAVGKTNFLETIFYTSVQQAFAPGKSWELIKFGQDFFRVELETDEQKLEFYYGKKEEKRYVRSQSIDGVKKKSSEMFGALPTVAFMPQDLNLLILSPGLRREYLDDILLQTEPGYEDTLMEFGKVLSQRNELLYRVGSGAADEDELDFWDERLSGLSSLITLARVKLAGFLNEGAKQVYKKASGAELDYYLRYPATAADSDYSPAAYIEMLKNSREKDIKTSQTNVGPHRDDWQISDEEGKDLAHYLSRGEQRSVIITLKLQELMYLQQVLGKTPVILLDELLAELDETRKKKVLENLPPDAQKFLTTTDLEEIPKKLLDKAQIIEFERP